MEKIIYEGNVDNLSKSRDIWDFGKYLKKELGGEELLTSSSPESRVRRDCIAYHLTPYSISLSAEVLKNEKLTIKLVGNEENIGVVEEIILKQIKK